MRRKLDAVIRQVRRLGVDVFFVPDETQVDGATTAPFGAHVALDWQAKRVYVRASTADLPEQIAGLIHEAGHAVAVLETPEWCLESDFFAWEMAVARKARVLRSWLANQGCYLTEYGEWRDMGARQRRLFVAECVRRGRRIGNLARDGAPRVVR